MVDSGQGNRSNPQNGVVMSEFEKQKTSIVSQLKNLCAHCASHVPHNCRLTPIAREVEGLSGVALVVNNRFNGIFFNN